MGQSTPEEATPPFSHPFPVGGLSKRKPTRFALKPDAAVRAQIAQALGLLELVSLRFSGEVRPDRSRDFVMEGRMDAIVVQPCSITLAPVRAELSEMVLRRYLADWTTPEGDEVEMPEDDTTEPLPEVIDAGHVAIEALMLALPLYPRAPGAELGEAVFAAPEVEPLRDENLKPFAGLAALKQRLEGGYKE
jgi:uncharacterized metal-binding protein YceD (DUF177 family)